MTDPETSAEHLAIARQAFGDEFVAFCLNCKLPLEGAYDDDNRVAALAELATLAHFTLNPPPGRDGYSVAWRVNLTQGSDTGGVIYGLRRFCGGEVQRPTSEDETELRLLECIYEAYPAILLPPSANEIPPYPDLMGMDSETFGLLVESFLLDEDLKRLFPNQAGRIEDPSQPDKKTDHTIADHWWMAGSGGTAFATIVANNLVEHAFRVAALRDERSLDACLQHGADGLRVARSLARGEVARVLHVTGYSNLRLQAGLTSIPLGSSELRSLSSRGKACIRPFGESAELAELAVFSEIDEQLVDLNPRIDDEKEGEAVHNKRWLKYFPKAQESLDKRRRNANLFRYTLLLATTSEVITAVPRGDMVLNPLTKPTSFPVGGEHLSVVPSAEVTAEIATSLAEWTLRVDEHHPTSLDIGMRRLLSAATTRPDDMDGFVDAVMCWENIFGDSQDTSLKVCGSLSRLLEPDDSERRRKLYESLKKMYELRSKLVHGASEPDSATASRQRKEAVDIAIGAMRALYDWPNLLKARNSVERWKSTLIGPSSR
ncbi:hypothetical protein [Verrucosispora sp. NA02020]|uniref:hypothetical protein n=1 Tax=Verrucosispora sp. NA02020 TaxID=2742132 RepID=UPI003D72E39C